MQMKVEKIQGFATDMGGKTSHTTIVAGPTRSRLSSGSRKITTEAKTGDIVIVDGTAGAVIVNPDPEIIRRYELKKKALRNDRGQPPQVRPKDGHDAR